MQNLLVIYMFISLGLYATTFEGSGINLDIDHLDDILHVSSFIDPNDITNPDFNSSIGIMGKLPESTGSSGIDLGTGFKFITDGLGLIFGVIKLIINLITMPITVFLSVSGMPTELIYFIAIPMGLMMAMGIVFFIRGFKG